MFKGRTFGIMILIVGIALIGCFVSCKDDYYEISLSQEGTYTFPDEAVGYSAINPLSVTVRNHGISGSMCKTRLSGPNANCFSTDNTGGKFGHYLGGAYDRFRSSYTYTVYPRDGLSAGTYKATVMVYQDTYKGHSVSFDVSFSVY